MIEVDEEELAYYRALCERLRACRRVHGYSGECPPASEEEFHEVGRPPASEEQLRAVQARLGFPLPPLLRMLYREVADGGPGIIGGSDFDRLDESMSLGPGPSRTGWRLHPCVERALQRHRFSYVVCEAWPDQFLEIGSYCYSALLLDTATGWTYRSEFQGDFPPPYPGARTNVYCLQFCRGSLWELCEDWLENNRFGKPYPAFHRSRGVVLGNTLVDRELTPDLLDPSCTDDPERIWHGLYRAEHPRDDVEENV